MVRKRKVDDGGGVRPHVVTYRVTVKLTAGEKPTFLYAKWNMLARPRSPKRQMFARRHGCVSTS